MIILHLSLAQEAAQKSGFAFGWLDQKAELAIIHHPDGRSIALQEGQYPINNALAARLAADKADTNAILTFHGINVPEGDWFYADPAQRNFRCIGKEREDAFSFANHLGFPVFVKPDRGSGGYLARQITTQEELDTHLTAIGQSFYKAIIQRVAHGEEYRITVLDGKVRYCYRKLPPFIIGNGVNTFTQLLEVFRAEHRFADSQTNNLYLPEHPDICKRLGEADLKATDILGLGQRFELADVSNLASGGTISLLSNTVSKTCCQWAAKVASSLGLRLAAIDLFATDGLAGNPDDFVVIEVNSNPHMNTLLRHDKRDWAVAVWEDILIKAFADDAYKAI